jgi:hypothetical protein
MKRYPIFPVYDIPHEVNHSSKDSVTSREKDKMIFFCVWKMLVSPFVQEMFYKKPSVVKVAMHKIIYSKLLSPFQKTCKLIST